MGDHPRVVEPDYGRLMEMMHGDIICLIKVMASDISNPNHWMLQHEEVMAELIAKMAEVTYRYADKPYDELKALVIKSLHNRKIDLTRQAYGSYRALEIGALPLGEPDEDDASDPTIDPPAPPVFQMYDFLTDLPSDDARTLVNEIFEPSDRLRRHVELTVSRKITTAPGGGWCLNITPLLMARGLGWDKERVAQAWNAVAKTLLDYVH